MSFIKNSKAGKEGSVNFSDNSQRLVFQQFHIDYYITPPPEATLEDSDLNNKENERPVICAFGRINEHQSVCCHIYGFRPHIYVLLPPNVTSTQCRYLKNLLNAYIRRNSKKAKAVMVHEAVLDLIIDLKAQKSTLIKIIISRPSLVSIVKAHLDTLKISLPGMCGDQFTPTAVNYTSNYVQMFRNEIGANAFCWIEIDGFKYNIRSQKVSSCQVEIETEFVNLVSHVPEGEWAKIVPFTILSFDIECECTKERFSESDKDAVLQIAGAAIRYGEEEPFLKTVFTLNSCTPLENASVYSYSTEKEMLAAWADFVVKIDPDVITGHSIINFDIPYLVNRAKLAKLDKPFNIGRITKSKTTWWKANCNSNRASWRQKNFCLIEGRVIFDLMLRMSVEADLSSYKLNYLSNHFINDKKEDVQVEDILILQNGDDLSRKRLAEYCLKDALLPVNIMLRRDMLAKYIWVGLCNNMQLCDVLGSGDCALFASEVIEKPLSIWKSSVSHNYTKTEPVVKRKCCDPHPSTVKTNVDDDNSCKSVNSIENQSLPMDQTTSTTVVNKPKMRRIGLSRRGQEKI